MKVLSFSESKQIQSYSIAVCTTQLSIVKMIHPGVEMISWTHLENKLRSPYIIRIPDNEIFVHFITNLLFLVAQFTVIIHNLRRNQRHQIEYLFRNFQND